MRNTFSFFKHIVYVFLILFVFTLPLIAEENTGETPTEDTSKDKEDTDKDKDKDKSKNNNLASSFNGIFNTFLSNALNDLKGGLFNGNLKFRGVCFNGNGSKYVSDTELREKINKIDSWFFGVSKTEKIQNDLSDLIEMVSGIPECGGIPVANGLCYDCMNPLKLAALPPRLRYSYYLPFHKVEATEYMAHTGYEEETYITSKMKTWGINRIDDISYLRDIHEQTKTKLQEVGICPNGQCPLQAQKILKPSTFEQVTDNDLLKNTPTTNSSGASTNIFTRVFPTGFHEFFTGQLDWFSKNRIEASKAMENLNLQGDISNAIAKHGGQGVVDAVNQQNGGDVYGPVSPLVGNFNELIKANKWFNAFSFLFREQWGHDGAIYAERKQPCFLAERVACLTAASNRKGLVKDGNGEHGLFYEAYGSLDENGHDYLESANPKVTQINNAISFVKSSSGIPGLFPTTETVFPEIDKANEKGFLQTGVCAENYTSEVNGVIASKCFNTSAKGTDSLNAPTKGPLVAYYRTPNHLEAAMKSVYRAMTWANAIEDNQNGSIKGSGDDDCFGPKKIFHPFFNENLSDVPNSYPLPKRRRSRMQLLKNNSTRYAQLSGCGNYSRGREFVPKYDVIKNILVNTGIKDSVDDKEIFPNQKDEHNHGRTTVIAIWNYLENCTSKNYIESFHTPGLNGIWY